MGLVAAAGARCAASPRAAGHGPPLAPRDAMHVRLGPALIAFDKIDSQPMHVCSPTFERAAACAFFRGMKCSSPRNHYIYSRRELTSGLQLLNIYWYSACANVTMTF